jgi:hypothetical protein
MTMMKRWALEEFGLILSKGGQEKHLRNQWKLLCLVSLNVRFISIRDHLMEMIIERRKRGSELTRTVKTMKWCPTRVEQAIDVSVAH